MWILVIGLAIFSGCSQENIQLYHNGEIVTHALTETEMMVLRYDGRPPAYRCRPRSGEIDWFYEEELRDRNGMQRTQPTEYDRGY